MTAPAAFDAQALRAELYGLVRVGSIETGKIPTRVPHKTGLPKRVAKWDEGSRNFPAGINASDAQESQSDTGGIENGDITRRIPHKAASPPPVIEESRDVSLCVDA